METNETKTDFYEVIVNENVEKIESEITINKNKKIVLSNKVEKPELNVELKSYIGRASKNQFCYFIYVTNATNRELKNIDIQTDEFIDDSDSLFIKDSLIAKTSSILNNKLLIDVDRDSKLRYFSLSFGIYGSFLNSIAFLDKSKSSRQCVCCSMIEFKVAIIFFRSLLFIGILSFFKIDIYRVLSNIT